MTDKGSRNLYVKETFVNRTKNAIFGESDIYESFTGDTKRLFRDLQKEYGRCTSKMYMDTPNGETKQIGWVFEKVMPYEDARSKDDTYLREVWVEVHDAEPTRTVKYHYHEWGKQGGRK